MNSRERLLAVRHGQLPDCLPACPDISNMIPARLAGKPFWDIFVHQDPPLWKACIDAARYFDIDAGFELYDFGRRIVLKGNLHTTGVMLLGSVEDVIRASKQCLDDAAAGGGFILSTGDQTPRDTPFENIFAVVETARTYGKY